MHACMQYMPQFYKTRCSAEYSNKKAANMKTLPLPSCICHLLSLILLSQLCLTIGTQPNPPLWPASVIVCDPSTPSITQAAADAAFSYNGGHSPPFHGQWSTVNYAFLFKPGAL